MTIEMRPEDSIARVEVLRRMIDTGTGEFVDEPHTGLTGGVLSVMRTRDGPDLFTVNLTEVGSLGIYTADLDGADLETVMAGLPDGALVFRKVQFSAEKPFIQAVIWRTTIYA